MGILITKKKVAFKFIVLIIISFAILFAAYMVLRSYIYPLKHFDVIKEHASNNSIDPYLVLAVIKSESGFDKNATSNKEAKGLMQIMDSTAKDISNQTSSDLYDENVNIELGCKYLASLINRYNGNYYLAICAYNAGMGNVDKWIEKGILPNDLKDYKNNQIPFKETKKYLEKVVTSYNIYRKLYN